eukprot:5132345-Pyramimonas_sp.AAC.1
MRPQMPSALVQFSSEGGGGVVAKPAFDLEATLSRDVEQRDLFASTCSKLHLLQLPLQNLI